MRQMFVNRLFVRCSLALGLVLAAPGVGALPKQGATASCDCYYFTDCPEEDIATCTGFGACGANGKLDGTCLLIPTGNPAPDANRLAEVLGLYFDAYLVPISSGEGRPSVEILTEAEGVTLSEVQHEAARNAVHDALDAVIGFDFQHPQAQGASNPGQGVGAARFGNIRGTANGAQGIAEAARTGISQAILTRNLNAIAGPLEAFWAAHPDFRPNHTGRLYPHGHAHYDEEIGSPLAGQIQTLRRIVLGLLSDNQPICGDSVRQGAEACDGTDDISCPALCSTTCTCGFVP